MKNKELDRKTFDEIIAEQLNAFLKKNRSIYTDEELISKLKDDIVFLASDIPNRNIEMVEKKTWLQLLYRHLKHFYYN